MWFWQNQVPVQKVTQFIGCSSAVVVAAVDCVYSICLIWVAFTLEMLAFSHEYTLYWNPALLSWCQEMEVDHEAVVPCTVCKACCATGLCADGRGDTEKRHRWEGMWKCVNELTAWHVCPCETRQNPSVSHTKVFLFIFFRLCLTEFTAVWPESTATGTPCPHSHIHTHKGSVCLSHTSTDACTCACFLVYPCVRSPPMCTAGQSLANKPAHARLALSARSGFNWMTDVPLTAAVGVIQTPRRSHRLQQVPPLSIKANPLSPARWQWDTN